MVTVWKYGVDITDVFVRKIPQAAKILDVQVQAGNVCMWVMVDTDMPEEERTFRVVGTGHPIEITARLDYIGTFQLHSGSFIGHLYENR